jgi:hypothetical protein
VGSEECFAITSRDVFSSFVRVVVEQCVYDAEAHNTSLSMSVLVRPTNPCVKGSMVSGVSWSRGEAYDEALEW